MSATILKIYSQAGPAGVGDCLAKIAQDWDSREIAGIEVFQVDNDAWIAIDAAQPITAKNWQCPGTVTVRAVKTATPERWYPGKRWVHFSSKTRLVEFLGATKNQHT